MARCLRPPGYDRQTRLLYDPLDIEFPPIPSHPTKAQAAEALKLYLDLVSTFPFYDAPNSTAPAGTSLAVAISAMLTTPFRRSMPTAPMHCFNAPIARSGKSKLADICSIIATGHAAAPLGFGKQPEEFEKRLGAALMQGNALIAIDNVSLPLESDTLCTMLTQTMVSARILGASALPELPSSAMILCNGNNLVLVGDLAARALMCTIDPQDPRPEMRDFSGIEDVLEKATRLRPELIAAGLTILLAYAEAGYPDTPRPLGSFEIWSKWVRGALLWLGLADPVASIEEIRTSDPALDTLEAVMYAWNRVFPPGTSTTSHELIDAANKVSSMGMPGDVLADRKFIYADLREALLNVAGAGGAGATLNNRRLGKWLSAHKNRIVQLDAGSRSPANSPERQRHGRGAVGIGEGMKRGRPSSMTSADMERFAEMYRAGAKRREWLAAFPGRSINVFRGLTSPDHEPCIANRIPKVCAGSRRALRRQSRAAQSLPLVSAMRERPQRC